jgi:asparagine synthetase B (glutamine-hydrolysing)
LVRSAVPNYILAAFTARHVKVVLTGEGADEIFAEDFGEVSPKRTIGRFATT